MATKDKRNFPSPDVFHLNQHFLEDDQTLDDIVELADITPEDTVLEIGPGRGDLTLRLLNVAKKVIAIEYDARLIPYLSSLSKEKSNLEIKQGDALSVNYPRFDVLVSNIPFNITEAFITRLFRERMQSATLLVGEQFASEATAESPTSRLGILSKAYFNTEALKRIPKTLFNPIPSTDGILLGLYPIQKKALIREFSRYMIRSIWDQKQRPLKDAIHSALAQYMAAKGVLQYSSHSFTADFTQRYRHPQGIQVNNISSPELRDLSEFLGSVNLKKCYGKHKPRGGAKNWAVQYSSFL